MPYGFPSGPELLNTIVEGEPGNWRLTPALQIAGFTTFDIERFLLAASRANLRSIDRFLGLRPEFADIGKAAITSCIGRREHLGALHARRSKEGQWYELLLERLDAAPEHWTKNQLSVVTFNYDRSLEQFLIMSLQHGFGIEPAEATRLVGSIPTVHPHGSLGSLNPEHANYRPYGSVQGGDQVRAATKDIRVLHEGQRDSDEFRLARELLSAASLIFVLGLSYDAATIGRLGLASLVCDHGYGTAYGLERIEFEEARGRCGRFNLWDPRFDIRLFLRGGPVGLL